MDDSREAAVGAVESVGTVDQRGLKAVATALVYVGDSLQAIARNLAAPARGED